jgi:hypothetical protein
MSQEIPDLVSLLAASRIPCVVTLQNPSGLAFEGGVGDAARSSANRRDTASTDALSGERRIEFILSAGK